jgi:cation transport protein ChaC
MSKMKSEDIWIFAYGSLCWRPGFAYEEMVLGHIKGFVRRFWQGNTVHRGTIEKPGRVATLISDSQGETYGCAFRVSGEKAGVTLRYLENRETKLGGYDSKVVPFYPCDEDGRPIKARLYIALPGNVDWRGPGKLSDIAEEVLLATGVCGSNLAYVTDLADFLRSNDFKDDHLFELESILLERLKLGGDDDELDVDNSSTSSYSLKESSPTSSASSSDLEILEDSI